MEGASLPPDVYPATAAPACIRPPPPFPGPFSPPSRGIPEGLLSRRGSSALCISPGSFWVVGVGVLGLGFVFFYTDTIVSMAVKEY